MFRAWRKGWNSGVSNPTGQRLADEAFSKAEAAHYDIAVLDVKMPHMSGIDLKKKLQQKAPDMKFIFVTGHGSAEDYSTGSQEGFCYIIKPFKIETLVEKLNQAMNA